MNGKLQVTFDFDDTLLDTGRTHPDWLATPKEDVILVAKNLIKAGFDVSILTTRYEKHRREVADFCIKYIGQPLPIYCTNHMWKAEYIETISKWVKNPLPNHIAHLDDNLEEKEIWSINPKFFHVNHLVEFSDYCFAHLSRPS